MGLTIIAPIQKWLEWCVLDETYNVASAMGSKLKY